MTLFFPTAVHLNCFSVKPDIDECASAPCQHGGICVDQVSGYLCHCAPGYTDVQCQTGKTVVFVNKVPLVVTVLQVKLCSTVHVTYHRMSMMMTMTMMMITVSLQAVISQNRVIFELTKVNTGKAGRESSSQKR